MGAPLTRWTKASSHSRTANSSSITIHNSSTTNSLSHQRKCPKHSLTMLVHSSKSNGQVAAPMPLAQGVNPSRRAQTWSRDSHCTTGPPQISLTASSTPQTPPETHLPEEHLSQEDIKRRKSHSTPVTFSIKRWRRWFRARIESFFRWSTQEISP